MLVFSALAPWIIGSDGVSSIPPSGGISWSAEIDRRVLKRAEALPHPRIIFVGGSSITFGLKPASLGPRIGAPVIAYGVTASLGVDVIARRAGDIVGPGDIVILAPELQHFSRRGIAIDNAMRAEWLRTVRPDDSDPVSSFPMRHIAVAGGRWRHLFVRAESALPSRIAPPRASSPIYAMGSLNAEGTIAADRPARARTYLPASAPLRPRAYNLESSVGVRAMDIILDRCRAVGAHPWFMPAIRTGDDMMSARDVRLFHAREQDVIDLARRKGFSVLLPAAGSSLPLEFGFDTGYHLNDRGVAAMENILAEALARTMQDSPVLTPAR